MTSADTDTGGDPAKLDEVFLHAAHAAREACEADAVALLLALGARRRYEDRPDGVADEAARLAVPVQGQAGRVGIIEVMGPRRSRFTAEDRQRLIEAAAKIARAYERVLAAEAVAQEAASWRLLAFLVGVGTAVCGLILIAAAIFVHQALALPLSELPVRPGMWAGLSSVFAGSVIAWTNRLRPGPRSTDVDVGRSHASVVGRRLRESGAVARDTGDRAQSP